jgi:ABC-type proline/glycine betaine transport system permease subunit
MHPRRQQKYWWLAMHKSEQIRTKCQSRIKLNPFPLEIVGKSNIAQIISVKIIEPIIPYIYAIFSTTLYVTMIYSYLLASLVKRITGSENPWTFINNDYLIIFLSHWWSAICTLQLIAMAVFMCIRQFHGCSKYSLRCCPG